MLTGTRLMKKIPGNVFVRYLVNDCLPRFCLLEVCVLNPKGRKATKFSVELRPTKAAARIFYHSSEDVGFFTD